MVAICIYLYKELPYNTSVIHTNSVHCWHQIMCHIMKCFIIICLMIENRIPQQQKHTLNALWNLKKKVLFPNMSTIWENTDVCVDQYGCVTALYLLSMLEH